MEWNFLNSLLNKKVKCNTLYLCNKCNKFIKTFKKINCIKVQ